MTKKLTTILAALALMVANTAHAGTTKIINGRVEVSTYVLSPVACSVNVAGNLDFGEYATTSEQDKTGNANVSVTCTKLDTSFDLYPGLGMNAGSGTDRFMTRGSSTLPYYLYQDGSLSIAWTPTSRVSATYSGSPLLYTVYGRIPAWQLSQDGSQNGDYMDTVAMTVEYNP